MRHWACRPDDLMPARCSSWSLCWSSSTGRNKKVEKWILPQYNQTSSIHGLIPVPEQTSSALRKRRQALLRQLPPLTEILRGSLIERYKPCGKPGCKCAEGPGHGPKYYLSISYPGSRPRMDYVPQGFYEQATEFLANYQRTREILEEICEINRELLQRREAL
jgi:hypothetical protein